MNEEEWLTSGAPEALLAACWKPASDRKKRLFGVACCRRVEHLLPDVRFKNAVRIAERFADGTSPPEALANAYRAAYALLPQYTRELYTRGTSEPDYRYGGTASCCNVSHESADTAQHTWWDAAQTLHETGTKWHDELAAIARLIRDVFENPFRPVSFDPAWRTGTTVSLARGMYDSREFGAMPILADALQDAGCEEEAILMHCRDANQPHVRGCWVYDLVLGNV
jgi:hypothetical protein